MKPPSPDRWDVFALAGLGLLGGGVWSNWGWAWACILWGILFLAVVCVHAWAGRPKVEGS